MSVIEKPSPEIVRKLYSALVTKPRGFEELKETTRIDDSTLNSALRFLRQKGMIIEYNFNRQTFRMVRTKPLSYGWNFPWLDLMISDHDWKTAWKTVYRKVQKNNTGEMSNHQFSKLLKDLLIDPNLDLIEVLDELNMTDTPLEVLKLHNQEPYCLECLKKEKRFVRMVLVEKSEEHCCPNCGVVRETLLVKRR
jgi:hypothetical protein